MATPSTLLHEMASDKNLNASNTDHKFKAWRADLVGFKQGKETFPILQSQTPHMRALSKAILPMVGLLIVKVLEI
jgi:hypothetical protein